MRTTQTLDYSEAKKIIDLIVEKALADAKGGGNRRGRLARRTDCLCPNGWRSHLFHSHCRQQSLDGSPGTETDQGYRRERYGIPKKATISHTMAIQGLWAGAEAFRFGKTARWPALSP